MQSPFAQTVEPESPGTGLAVPLGDVNEVFKPGGLAPFVAAVKEHVASLKPKLDVSTEEGRAFIVSTAYKITRTKTFVAGKAKGAADALKAQAKDIMTEADFMSSELSKLSTATRQPVTDRENEGAERAADYELKLGEIYNACLFAGAPTIELIQQRMAKLRGYESIDWQEYRERAETGFAECFPALKEMLRKAEQYEADRKELEDLRAFKASTRTSETVFGEYLDSFTNPDGEAIPPRLDPVEELGQQDKDDIAVGDLLALKNSLLDYDQAWDIINAIKAGKIRHVTINY